MMKPAKQAIDIGMVVSNIQASLDFYQNTLGLKFENKMPLPFGTMHRLSFGSADFKLIEPKEVPPKGAMGLEKQLGFRYVTFLLQNLSEVCAALRSKGIEFVMGEQEFRPGIRIAMVKDPDGNIVEFVERNIPK